jgi:hypothetical protein
MQYSGTVLYDYLKACGISYFTLGDMNSITRSEERTMLRSLSRIGAEKKFSSPRPFDLVVLKRLDGDGHLESQYNNNILRKIQHRGIRDVKRIVVLAAVTYTGSRLENVHDFRDSKTREMKARVANLLDELHATYPSMDLAVKSSSDSDEDLYFAVHASARHLVLDHGGFGRVAGRLAIAAWNERVASRNWEEGKGGVKGGERLDFWSWTGRSPKDRQSIQHSNNFDPSLSDGFAVPNVPKKDYLYELHHDFHSQSASKRVNAPENHPDSGAATPIVTDISGLAVF